MGKEKIDIRVIQILRWSILLQVVFIAISTFSPRAPTRGKQAGADLDLVSLVSIGLMGVIAALLFFKKIARNINRRTFLFILYALALSTIFARQYFSVQLGRAPQPLPRLSAFRWDAIFYLIIPLVFIAWQYDMRQVVLYSLVMTVADNVQPILQRETGEVLLVFINFLGSLARAGIFFIVGWIENQLVKVTRSQQDELREANTTLRKYALSAEKLAQTQERNRLARELHDTLAHTLSSSAVQLEAARSLYDSDHDGAKEMIEKTLENTRSGLVETRRALADLRASELESYGLNKAIRNLADTNSERGGFKVNFRMDKNLDMLPEDITHALYRTAQESLENILRHANAKNVKIGLSTKGSSVILSIEDDGEGFSEVDLSQDQFGIRGMRERIEMLGGKLTVDSSPGNGTRVLAELEPKVD